MVVATSESDLFEAEDALDVQDPVARNAQLRNQLAHVIVGGEHGERLLVVLQERQNQAKIVVGVQREHL